MNAFFTKSGWVALFCLFCSYLSAQTTTFDYKSGSFSTSDCNIFDPPVTVSNVEHSSRAGGVSFSSSDGLLLSTTPQANTPGGTAFAIKYDFIPGFYFDIAITALGSKYLYLKTSVVPNFNQFPTAGTTLCSPDGSVSSYSLAGYGTLNKQTSTTSTIYNVPQFSLPSGTATYPYLIVWVSGGDPSLALDNLAISKIEITKTPIAGYTIDPTSVTIACGATTATTFTVSGTAGASNYTFNLGANNGWLYGGSPAPRTIPMGTVNSITLTPDCGKPLNNVSATVTLNSTNYTTNTSTITVTPPSLSITGSNSLCSGSGIYSIAGLPCNASVAWTAPPSAQGSLSPLSGGTTTLSYGGTPGDITLTANVNSCGASQTLTLPVRVGGYTANDYSLSWNAGTPPYYCLNQTITFTLSGGGAGSNYSWSAPYGWTLNYNGGSYAVFRTPSSTGYPPTGSVTVTFTEPCGSTISKSFQTVYSSNYCGTPGSPYTISPNPASSTITIACASLQTYCNISQVQITDLYGTLKASQSWPYTNQSVQMSVSNLANGTYIAKVYNGTQWYSNQFVVQH